MAGGVGRDAAGEDLASRQEVLVGLVGPHALLERIVLAAGLPGQPGNPGHPDLPGQRPQRERRPGRHGRAGSLLEMTADDAGDDGLRGRLLTAAYADEQGAPAKVRRLGSVGACLFASPAPLAYAQRAGVLRCPALPIHLADGPLLVALTRASKEGYDPAKASFDTFSRLEVMHALAELSIPARRPHVREEIASPAAMASYHARLWQLGQTSIAVTCLDAVERRLAARGVPAIVVRPSDQAIASALRTAILLAERHALTAAQLAVALIEVPELRDRSGQRAPRLAREELRLAVHALLAHEARQIEAAVTPVSDHGFLVIATRESLVSAGAADGELRFRAAAARTLGIGLEIGIGTGRTEAEAEEAARQRLPPRQPVRVRSAGTARQPREPARAPYATTAGTGGEPLPGAGSEPAAPAVPPADSLSRLRSLETLTMLARKLAADAAPVVDAELTGQLLSVTPRTARRQLRAMADQGLALPLPPRRSRHPGRPRQAYRLVLEELGREAAR